MNIHLRQTLTRAIAAAFGISSVLFASTASGQLAERRMMQSAQIRLASPGSTQSSQTIPQGTDLQRLACTGVTAGEPINLALGKSRLIQLQSPAIRLIGAGRRTGQVAAAAEPSTPAPATGASSSRPTGGAAAAAGASDGVAETDITLLSPTELLIVGRRPGSANVILQDREGRCVVRDITVTVDPLTLESTLRQLVPNESGIRVAAADNAIVLTGSVRDVATLDQVMTLADVYGNGRRVVNLLRVSAPQQVMLEVKIAEVSKSLLDRFGLDFSRVLRDGPRFSVFSGLIGGRPGGFGTIRPRPNRLGEFDVPASFPGSELINSANSAFNYGIDVQTQDGIFRVLAEPNIMAISGQSASFLSGGKIFIPVAQAPTSGGGVTITLEEKEFGVGLKFTPTVLDGRINLKVLSEVSELSQTGTPFTTVGGVTAVLPSLTTRRVDTTVQLADGQSFAVAGLIRNNVTEAIDKFPGLGETPVVGALFRSTEFQNDKTELLFVITPRLVQPITGQISLPTDNHVVPTRTDVILRGAAEGSLPPTNPSGAATPAIPAREPAQPQPQPSAPAIPPTPPSAPPRSPTSESTPPRQGLVMAPPMPASVEPAPTSTLLQPSQSAGFQEAP